MPTRHRSTLDDVILRARYRLHVDVHAPVREQDIDKPTYAEAYAQAVGDTPDGHDLLYVMRIDD